MLFGTLLPRSGEVAQELASVETALAIGIAAWNANARGAAARSVGAVICDETVEAAVPHLLSLKPAFVVGPFLNQSARDLVAKVPDLTAFSPTVDDVRLTTTVDLRRRLATCMPNNSLIVSAVNGAVNLLAERLTTEREVTSKVRLVYTSDEADTEFAALLQSALQLDGVPVAQSSRFRAISFPYDPRQISQPSLVALASTLASDQTDLVVIASKYPSSTLVSALDLRWGAQNPGMPRPSILVVHKSSFFEASRQNLDVGRERFFAVDWQRSQAQDLNFAVLQGALLSSSSTGGGTGTKADVNASATNDCLYTGLYSALAAAGRAATSMLTVSQQTVFESIGTAAADSSKTAVRLIPEDIPKGVGLLATQPPTPTFLNGTFADMGLGETRTPAGTAGLFCMSSSSARIPRAWRASGVAFNAQGVPSGAINCE